MPRPPTIIGHLRNWLWLEEGKKIQAEMHDHKDRLLNDGSSVVLEVKYKSYFGDIFSKNAPYYLIATPFSGDNERYIMYLKDQKDTP